MHIQIDRLFYRYHILIHFNTIFLYDSADWDISYVHFARKLHKLLRTETFSLFNSQIICSLSWRVEKLRQISEESEISLFLSEAWAGH